MTGFPNLERARRRAVEFADNASVAATGMRASVSGAFARFETRPLPTAQEAQWAVRMVKECTAEYRALNA